MNYFNSDKAFDFDNVDKKVEVLKPVNLYRWNRHYFRLQSSFFVEPFVFLREKQIEDFVRLNNFGRVYVDKDTDVFRRGFEPAEIVSSVEQADLVVITNQNFSRYPCTVIIEKINQVLQQCPAVYLALNRHYINIDNSYHDQTLDDDYEVAITQWLKRELKPAAVVDMSFRFDDRGTYLAWSIPDRHYFITK